MDNKVLEELVKTRNALKRKFRSIKRGEANTFEKLEETFKPITEPLKEFIDISNKRKQIIKVESNREIRNNMGNNTNLSFKRFPMKTSTPKKGLTSEGVLETLENTNDDDDENFYSQSETLENSSLPNTIDLSILAKNNKLDTLYGPHKGINGEWKFGNSNIKLIDDKIQIGNQNWLLTPGLFELMFHAKPKNYDKTELSIYKKILMETNAYKREFKSDGQIKGTRAYKYQKIIGKLLQDDKSGKGLMKLNSHKPNYIYWDDPNELVDRLRLIIASQAAGHNNHNNEIVSIVEELREADIIV